jgi:hypothetical protein
VLGCEQSSSHVSRSLTENYNAFVSYDRVAQRMTNRCSISASVIGGVRWSGPPLESAMETVVGIQRLFCREQVVLLD